MSGQDISLFSADTKEEVAALITTLHATGQRLEELTAGQVDTVADGQGRTFVLRNAQEQLRRHEGRKQAAILDVLPANIALIDARGIVVSVNEAWRRFADGNGLHAPGHGVGLNYLQVCEAARGPDATTAREVAFGIRAVLAGEASAYNTEYPCHSSTQQRWFLMTVTPLLDANTHGAVVMHLDISERVRIERDLRESDRRLSNMLDNVELVSVMLDAHARIVYCNDFFLRLTGWQRDDVIGSNWFDVFAATDAPGMRRNFEELLAENPASLHNESQLITRSGEHRLICWNNSVLHSGSGDVIGTASIGEDITERKAAEAVLTQRATELERFHRLSVGRELQMVELKTQINEMAIKAGEDATYNVKSVEPSVVSARIDLSVGERTKQLTDSAIAALNMMEDAVRQREQVEQMQDKLTYLAYYDALTGLANQTLFLQRVQAKLLPASNDKLLVVLVLDILRFKSINDAFGRLAGDDLLKQVAERLASLDGDPDRFARIGADRFAVVATELESAEQVGRYTQQRLETIFGPPFRIAGNDVHVSVKLGIALYPFDGADADTLLRNSEAALKKAKATGESFLFFTPAMTARVAERLSLEHRLRQAVDHEEFVLHYQPKVSLATGKLTGAEALIRWNDPTTGLVPPGMFIPILEETGLIQDVGRWAMRTAMGDYLRWRSLGLTPVRIAVNVSAVQLRNRDFIDEVRQIVAMDVHAADGLELEITESMIMDDVEQAVATLHEIRAMGVPIAIDDFGTGFSSLAYLSKLPIDTLKVDRAFVNDLQTGPQGFALVNTIITLAHSLQLKVVAEGVETEEQLQMLQLLGCDDMQGYLFSKPVPLDVFQSKYLTTYDVD